MNDRSLYLINSNSSLKFIYWTGTGWIVKQVTSGDGFNVTAVAVATDPSPKMYFIMPKTNNVYQGELVTLTNYFGIIYCVLKISC